MRAQAHTIEAFAAAALIIAALVFATQATAVTPLSASTSNTHIENQQRATVQGLLSTAAEDGSLREAVLYWNATAEEFHAVPEHGTYVDGGPPNAFGEALDRTLFDRRIAFNVYVRHATPDGDTGVEPMVEMGAPSDNAVSATRTIGLYNSSELTSPGHEGETLANVTDGDGSFYADDVGDGQLYNVLEVHVVAWRK